jgi:predicted ATPase
MNSPLYPAIQQIEFAAGFKAGAAAGAKLDMLEALLRQSSAPPDVVPLIAALLSIEAGARYEPLDMAPEELKEKTLQALVTLFEGLAARRPVLFLLEDAHWIDPTTRELLDLLVARVGTMRGLILVTYRPEFESPWPNHAHCTVLRLNRLGREACEALVGDLTGTRGLPQEVLDQIIAKTDGVPLFVEELTKTVLESGLLALRDDDYVLTGPLPPVAIPSTLQDSLMARLDRLEAVKEIAQIGAAIGREFPYALLEEVGPWRGPALEQALERLSASEIVFRRGAPPNAVYVFKHALIQDAAYQSLLRKDRRDYHARIADALDERFPELVESEP